MLESEHINPDQERGTFRLAFLSGGLDAVKVYDSWKSGEQLGYFGSLDVKDFFKVCSDLRAEGYIITTLPQEHSRRQFGKFLIENRPMPQGLKGALYHFGIAFWLVRTIPTIVRFRPHILVVSPAANYWFLLSVLKCVGVIIIPSLTCTLWPKFAPARFAWRILLGLNAIFYSLCVTATLAASEDIARQVRNLVRGKKIPIATYLPIYQHEQFAMFRPPDFDARPFKVFFAGRIERDKGVYDLVAVAQMLSQREPSRFQFDICGDGSELKALRQHIADLGLRGMVNCHGFCERSKLSPLMQESHVVIVPTTTQFQEGFNMVCAEAILAGRPIVTSAVCPALEYVKEAAVEVQPDSVPAYCQALLDLANDRKLYERKLAACKPIQGQFYDVRNGWGSKLRELIDQRLQGGAAF